MTTKRKPDSSALPTALWKSSGKRLRTQIAKNQARVARRDTLILRWKSYGAGLATKLAAKETENGKLKTKNAELQGTIHQWSERDRKLKAELADKDAKNQARVARRETTIAQWKSYGTGLATKLAAKETEVVKLKTKSAELQGTIHRWSERDRKLQAKLAGKDAEIKKLKELSRRDETSSTGSNISGLCIVCHDNEANVAMVPCGHVCLCTSCSEEYTGRMSNCPMGCGRYESTLKVYRG